MSTEPLWRGPLDKLCSIDGSNPVGDGDFEVELWRAGDRPTPPDVKPLAVAKFWQRHTPPVGPDYVTLRVYEGQKNLHIDGEYAVYRRTDGPAGDRPVPPTRQQIVDAIDMSLNDPRLFPGAWSRTPAHYVDAAADALLELLSGGVPTEPEETTDWETDEVNRRSEPMGLLDGADGDMAEIADRLAAKYPEATLNALLAAGAIEQVGWRSAVDGSLWDMRMGGEPFTGDNYQGDAPVYRLTQKTEGAGDG